MMDFAALNAFLAELNLNNHKAWFEEHRTTYQALRDQFTAFVGQVIDGIAAFDPPAGVVHPKDALFRINRDVRFSPDKRPYKTTFSAAICPQGRNSGYPVYYFQVNELGDLFIAGGSYMPPPPLLAQIRQHIARHREQLAAVLADAEFRSTFGDIGGERLKRPPQGYDETTPYLEYVKLKSFIVSHEPADWLDHTGDLDEWIVRYFRSMRPLINWLRTALGANA
jgi:uncharacterized protein (TIGR02453 family)